MNDERGRGDLPEHGMRLEAEDLVEDRTAVPQRRRELEVALFGELPRGLLAEVVVPPIGAAVNGALLVIQLRVQQNQARDFTQPLGGVVAADAAAEARAEQADVLSAGCFPDMRERNPDGVEEGAKCHGSRRPPALPGAAE